MSKHPSRRGYFFTAMMGSLIGLLAGVLLVGMVPAAAGNGDNLILGASNKAGRSTWLTSRGPSVLKLNNTAGNPVLDLRNGGAAAPLTVDSRKRVVNLSADRLDGRHARDLIRVGYDSTDDAADRNGYAAATSITAPRAGYLVISGSVAARFAGTNDYLGCHLTVDDSQVTGTRSIVRLNTDHLDELCSSTGVQAVDAGAYTVALNVVEWHTAALHGATVWVLYVPFDGAGAAP
jgi:hypothetical protein